MNLPSRAAEHLPQPLTPAERAELEEFLDSDAVPEESLDAVGAHGFLTALAIAPNHIDPERWLPELFSGIPTYEGEEGTRIPYMLEQLRREISLTLYRGIVPPLPCPLSLEPDPDSAPLARWCSGFMEGVFLDEQSWFAPDEERMAELTLPLMVASGLFDEDPELERLRRDRRHCRQLVREIPELLVDLYLLFHSSIPGNRTH